MAYLDRLADALTAAGIALMRNYMLIAVRDYDHSYVTFRADGIDGEANIISWDSPIVRAIVIAAGLMDND